VAGGAFAVGTAVGPGAARPLTARSLAWWAL